MFGAREPMRQLANDIWAPVMRSLAGSAHNAFLKIPQTLLLALPAGWMNVQGRP